MTCSQIILAEQICNIQILPAAKTCTLNSLLLVSYIIATCSQNMHAGQDLDLQDRNITCRQSIHAGQVFPLEDIDNTCSQSIHMYAEQVDV